MSEIDDLRAAAERLRKDVEELTHILDSHRVTYPDKLGHWSCEPEIERLTLADRQWADHFKRLAEENERLTRTNNQAIERMRIAESHKEAEQERREDAEAAATTLEWQLSEATKEIERLRAVADAAEAILEVLLLAIGHDHVSGEAHLYVPDDPLFDSKMIRSLLTLALRELDSND